MNINFVNPPRLSSGDLRRGIMRQCALLMVSTSGCALIGTIIASAYPHVAINANASGATPHGLVPLCQDKLEVLERRVSLLRSAAASRAGPHDVLAAVSETIPQGVWMVSLQTRERRVEIEGRALTDADLREFVVNLERKKSIDHVAVVSSAMSSRDVGSLDFIIVAEHETMD